MSAQTNIQQDITYFDLTLCPIKMRFNISLMHCDKIITPEGVTDTVNPLFQLYNFMDIQFMASGINKHLHYNLNLIKVHKQDFKKCLRNLF